MINNDEKQLQQQQAETEPKAKPKMSANAQTEEKPYRPSIKLVKPAYEAAAETKTERTSRKKSFASRLSHLGNSSNSNVKDDATNRFEPNVKRKQQDLLESSKRQQQNEEELSEMEKERRLRAQANEAFARNDNRVAQIDFESIVKPYQSDFNDSLLSSHVIASLMTNNFVVIDDSFLTGNLLFLFLSSLVVVVENWGVFFFS